MKFHPEKCKVLTITNRNTPTSADKFVYCLDNVCLDFVNSEKDLGVHITSKLNWKEHVFYLCSKANRMLGLVKRTCHFVKNPHQKRVFYLALVCSQFNHCSSIWRPTSLSLLNKIERVQIKAVKWILSEQYTTYTAKSYFNKCKVLNLLPLKLRLDWFAILIFHKIIHKTIAIDLPAYITLAPHTTLRSSHNDPLTFVSSIKPRITKKIGKKSKHHKKNNKMNKTKAKTTKKITKTIKRRKKKPSTFFKKHRTRENMYTVDKNGIEEFSENKVLTNSFFYRTYIQWNNLPLEIKIIEKYEEFKLELEMHLWESILEDEDVRLPDD